LLLLLPDCDMTDCLNLHVDHQIEDQAAAQQQVRRINAMELYVQTQTYLASADVAFSQISVTEIICRI
jgi:hypothetical protein